MRSKPLLLTTLIALFGAAPAACAPTVTELDPPADQGASNVETDPADVPAFPQGEVEHSAFVEPPVDVSNLRAIEREGPIRVVATIGQITDIVERIGGDRVSVAQIVPGNDDPHRYVPTPGDVANLSEADIIFYNGLFLEGQMGETFERMEGIGIPAVAVTAGFPQEQLLEREYSPGNFVTDPHVWFDPDLWTLAARNVALTLAALDPGGAELFDTNVEALAVMAGELAEWGAGRFQTVPQGRRVLVTSHDAFGYFGRRLGIEVKGLQGLSTEAEAGTQDVQELVDFIIARGVPAVFVEASVSPEALQAVVEAVRAEGGDVGIGGELFSDTPGRRGESEGSYPGMVLWNVATIVTALGGDLAAPLPPTLAADPYWDYAQLVEQAAAEAAGHER